MNPEIVAILQSCYRLHNCDWYCAVRGLRCIAVPNAIVCYKVKALRESGISDYLLGNLRLLTISHRIEYKVYTMNGQY